jgi:diaminopimelate epimerase
MSQRFYKMSGSGNDFVFFDARRDDVSALENPRVISALSSRGTGIGADGVVFLADSLEANVALRYYNADGSAAALCGNATLCTTRLASELGGVDPAGFTIATGSGVLHARMAEGEPEFDFPVVRVVEPKYAPIPLAPGELRLGFAIAGVPHVVILVEDIEAVDVVGRGRPVRFDESLAEGANVNFVAADASGRWAIRTYERGVENETLACGTGNVASAILLTMWGEASGDVQLMTRSGKVLTVRTGHDVDEWRPSLRGEGRLVFTGALGEL